MSEKMFVFLVVVFTMVVPLIAIPIIITHNDNKVDKITKLEHRVENLEKVIIYTEMKE